MKTINILHIYSEILDLYGDYFNVTCIKNHIEQMGYSCTVKTCELDDEINLNNIDFVYIGHGKAKSLEAVTEHFCKYGTIIKNAIENNTVFLVTGNARMLFGKSFTDKNGNTFQGIGQFDYTGYDNNQVLTADIYGECAFNREIEEYGFVNRTQALSGKNSYPLFHVKKGPCDGAENTGVEGTLYKNFFGTWQMGPLLPRNPEILREILKRILKNDFKEFDDTLEKEALSKTIAEFHKN